MHDRYQHALIPPSTSIQQGIALMNREGLQILLVVDPQQRLQGTVTDGDIRRGIARGLDLTQPITEVMYTSPTTVGPDQYDRVHELLGKGNIRHVPVVDESGRVLDVVDWTMVLPADQRAAPTQDIPVVIMAGGKGTRLRPITRILPKPLVPVGPRTLVERVMDAFHADGFHRFVLTLNYRAEMVREYFAEADNPYSVEMVEEEEFLGTAGALGLVRDRIPDTVVVSNCDVIVEADFDSLLRFHREQGAAATVLAVLRTMSIPYGVLQTEGFEMVGIEEKPEYHYMVNSGIYVLEPQVLDLLPEGQRMDMPDLLMAAREAGMKVMAYPMHRPWFDVGKWDQHKRAVDYLDR